jgi:tetratricopeptide (TPR) repeat protein
MLHDVKVIHDNLGRKEPSKDRNLRILYKAVETEEYRNNFRMWDHLAQDSPPVKGVLFFQKIVDEFFGELSPAMKSRVLIRYGDALMALSRFEEALEMYGRAAAHFPLWREPFFGAGKALMKLKRNESSLKMFLIAGTIDKPGKEVRLFNQAMYDGELYYDWLFFAQKRLGLRDDMLVTIEQALKIHPTSEMFLKRKAEFMPQPQTDAA